MPIRNVFQQTTYVSNNYTVSGTNNINTVCCNTVYDAKLILKATSQHTGPHNLTMAPPLPVTQKVFSTDAWRRESNTCPDNSPFFLLPCQRWLCEFSYYKLGAKKIQCMENIYIRSKGALFHR